MNINAARIIPLLFFGATALAQQGKDNLQINVPYLCGDGKTYIVIRCETGPKGEYCSVMPEGGHERVNSRAQIAWQMSGCKLKPASSGGPHAPAAQAAPASSDFRLDTTYECAGGLRLTSFACQRQNGQEYCFVRAEMNGDFVAQVPKLRSETAEKVKSCKVVKTFDPPYMAEFPSNRRVVQGMLVGNPSDNVKRAIGASYQLSEIITVLAGQRPLTADEKKFLDDYSRLSREMAQAAAQKFPGEKFDPETNPYRYSPTDPKFGFEGIPVWTTFLSPAIQAQFAQTAGGNSAAYMAAVEQEKRKAFEQVQTEAETAASDAKLAKDSGSVAARHCLESGRGELECLGEGLKEGANELMGGNPLKGLSMEGAPGLRLTGMYSAGHEQFIFFQDHVEFGCGSLVRDHYPYSVESNGSQVRVTIRTAPKPLEMTFKDGKLIGPGPVVIGGRVPAGGPVTTKTSGYQMQSQTATSQKPISAMETREYSAGQVHQNGMEYSVDQQTTSTTMVPTTTTRTEVPMTSKTEHCNLGIIPAKERHRPTAPL